MISPLPTVYIVLLKMLLNLKYPIHKNPHRAVFIKSIDLCPSITQTSDHARVLPPHGMVKDRASTADRGSKEGTEMNGRIKDHKPLS